MVIEYFDFEEDFVESNIRCIPMIVRLKMDKAGIKLRLEEWSRFAVSDRMELATRKCDDAAETVDYYNYAAALILRYAGRRATSLTVAVHPAWEDDSGVPDLLQEKLDDLGTCISLEQWRMLTQLQRFALLKLCRPDHENRNFPLALKEFGLV